jgi:hypothetical protein
MIHLSSGRGIEAGAAIRDAGLWRPMGGQWEARAGGPWEEGTAGDPWEEGTAGGPWEGKAG